MMMPSTMILTICISMVLKRNYRGLSLDIGSRYERAEHTKLITLITNLKSWIQSLPQTDALISSARMLLLLNRDWGGSNPTPIHKFSVTSVGIIFNQWGVKPPLTLPRPTNRTLVYGLFKIYNTNLKFTSTGESFHTFTNHILTGKCKSAYYNDVS